MRTGSCSSVAASSLSATGSGSMRGAGGGAGAGGGLPQDTPASSSSAVRGRAAVLVTRLDRMEKPKRGRDGREVAVGNRFAGHVPLRRPPDLHHRGCTPRGG